jgi:amino acid transporter
MDGKQITTIILILVGVFALPSSIYTFVTQSSFDNRESAASINENINNSVLPSVTRNPNYYYIFAFVAIMTSILLILLYIERRNENKKDVEIKK